MILVRIAFIDLPLDGFPRISTFTSWCIVSNFYRRVSLGFFANLTKDSILCPGMEGSSIQNSKSLFALGLGMDTTFTFVPSGKVKIAFIVRWCVGVLAGALHPMPAGLFLLYE